MTACYPPIAFTGLEVLPALPSRNHFISTHSSAKKSWPKARLSTV